jgi:hypothetical protein
VTDERREHWETIYQEKNVTTVSWFENEPSPSVRLIRAFSSPDSSVLDCGAGASTTLSTLESLGYDDLTALDIAQSALSLTETSTIKKVRADVTTWEPERIYAVWHDRAVFHFCTTQAERAAYRQTVLRATEVGSVVIVGTFGEHGPDRCSNLPARQYSTTELATFFGTAFQVVHEEVTDHVTPSGAVQSFSWVVLQRVS